jgi:hypothetical protein
MARIPKIVFAEKYFVNYLEENGKKVYSETDLVKTLDENRFKWGLPATTGAKKLLDKFVDRKLFRSIQLVVGGKKVERFIYKEASIYEIALSLRSKSYISHYPALLFNDLTNQIPKTIYVTHELSPKLSKPSMLSQSAIDAAFSKPQRRSGLECTIEDNKIVLLEGKSTNRAGVVSENNIAYTNLERTLVDATVRPNYAGGAFSVLEAFRNAIDKKISVNKLAALLNKMDFIYPYHQAIGFYLERAGYNGNLLDLLRRKPMDFDFYLDYDMAEKEYSPNWKIYYPKGM